MMVPCELSHISHRSVLPDMFSRLLAAFLLLLVAATASAQRLTVSATVVDATTKSVLPAANVLLIRSTDSTDRHGAVTGRNGIVSIENVAPGNYTLRVSYMGYETLTRPVTLRAGSEKLGTLALTPGTVGMDEVVVEARIPPVEQKADTTVYNAAGFKTNPDATVEDLVTKLPGVTVDRGQVKAGGEEVRNLLVDGRRFFGDDPAIAMRNLPADIVDKVQVYDRMSDQAELTGFDDGQSQKTINIITRASRRSGSFGRISAGYGTTDRYSAGGNFNYFGDTMRVSVIGLTNNVNQQNFSIQDLLGASGINTRGGFVAMGMRMLGVGRGGAVDNMVLNMASRGGGGGFSNFMVGQQNGLTTTNSIGTNISDETAWGLKSSGSYFFNHTRNTNDQLTARQYFLTGDASQLYDEDARNTSRSGNHRVNGRFEYIPDTLNTFIITPRANYQASTSNNLVASSTTLGGGRTTSLSNSNGDNDLWNAGAGATWRHRFQGVRGRSVVLNLNGSANNRVGDSWLDADNRYTLGAMTGGDTVRQYAATKTRGYSLSGDLSYTEQFGSSALMLVNYGASWSDNHADRRTWAYNYMLQQYNLLQPELSSVLDNGYMTQRGGVGMRFRGEGWNSLVQMQYQRASLTGDETFPTSYTIDRAFNSILPSAQVDWRFDQTGSIRLNYRTNTTAPAVTQLQDAVDNSNPLLVSTGNPDLVQDYSHTLFLRYGRTNMATLSGFFVFLSGGITNDYLGTSTTIATADTVLSNGYTLQRGAQLTRPVNLAGYRNLRTFVTWSRPVPFISSNLTLTGGLMYARTPGITNGIETRGDMYNVTAGAVIASNISENFDFTISYTANQNYLRNAIGVERNSDYFSHLGSIRVNWIFWEGLVLRGDLTHTLSNGLGEGYNQDFLLLNGSIGKKFFSDQSLEISLNVFDLLDRNKSSLRLATEAYVEDVRSSVLGRHVLLTASYTLRAFPTSGGPGRGPGGLPPMPGMGPGRRHDGM
jgi:hypothetical protein